MKNLEQFNAIDSRGKKYVIVSYLDSPQNITVNGKPTEISMIKFKLENGEVLVESGENEFEIPSKKNKIIKRVDYSESDKLI